MELRENIFVGANPTECLARWWDEGTEVKIACLCSMFLSFFSGQNYENLDSPKFKNAPKRLKIDFIIVFKVNFWWVYLFWNLNLCWSVELAEHSHRAQILSMALKRPVKHQTLVSVVRIRLSSFIPFCLLSVMQSCDKMKADASLIIMGPKDTNEVIHRFIFSMCKN